MDRRRRNYHQTYWLLALSLIAPAAVGAQSPDDREVSWTKLAPNILSDQANIWTLPVRLARGQDVFPTIAVLGGTAAFIASDPHDTPYFRRTTAFDGFNKAFSSTNTSAAIALVPAALYFTGLVRKDSYAQNTALLAAEAVIDSEIVNTALRTATRRVRPSSFGPGPANSYGMSDSFFESPGSFLGRGSFASGHTIAAFSVATVISRRYARNGKNRWLPYVAYGAAGLIGFSRLTLSAHFPADIFLGAALGYPIARFSVLHGR